MLVRLSKAMSKNTVTSVALNTGRGESSLKYLRCQKNRPVNVLTSDDQNMMLSLKEVRNCYAIVQILYSSLIRCARDVTRMGQVINAYEIMIGKPQCRDNVG
jgi:hypothetical protein